MLISQSAEYALRAVVVLAQQPGRVIGTREISQASQIPPGYLAKVLQKLARAGLVSSTPGRRGGFSLQRSPEQLSVLDVVNAVDPVERIRECPLRLSTHGSNLCPLHRRLDDAFAQVEAAFSGSTIADLLRQKGSVTPLCESVPTTGF